MEFRVECFEGEDREGFYVQPLMKRMWAVQLDILKVIDTICRRHNLKYWGWYGTLLGAVRHHGFIPWDDDIDLAMLREDIEKFQYFCSTELPDGWKLYKPIPTLIRVINTDIIKLSQDFLDKYHGCPYVMGIDIFSLDCIPSDKEEEDMWLNMFGAAINLYTYWESFAEDAQWESGKWEQLKDIENLTGFHFDQQKDVKEQLLVLADNIAAMYWDSGSGEVTTAATLYRTDGAYRIPRSCFDKLIRAPFENTTIPLPADYDLACRLIYGNNYMTPVKYAEHEGFKVQIDILKQHFKEQGSVFPECISVLL